MKFVWYLLAGLCGGVLAGMGMGGGTLTIPILVLLLSAGQLTAQFANLVAFLPTGAAALGMHLRGGLVKGAPLPATAAASFFAREGGETLGKLYGGFLVLIAAGGLVSGVLPGRAGK